MQYELPSGPATRSAAVVTVSQLLRNVRDTLERRFPLMWVRGELSNLSRAPSGHCYFTLKDDGAQVDCVMFKFCFAALGWEPANGAQVEARALVSLYSRAAASSSRWRRCARPGWVRSTSGSCT